MCVNGVKLLNLSGDSFLIRNDTNIYFLFVVLSYLCLYLIRTVHLPYQKVLFR